MENPDFVVVGSGGGGGTISWILAKAGFRVVLLEQGNDFVRQAEADLGGPASSALNGDTRFDRQLHDEYRFRLERPDPKRRLRGSYTTFRKNSASVAQPLGGWGLGGFTGSVLGGGSMLWGTWSFRALPIDFRLKTHFDDLGESRLLKEWGYAVEDWPLRHADLEPYYNLAEALFATCGDRAAFNRAVAGTEWFKEFAAYPNFLNAGNWSPSFDFQGPPYPMTPVGYFFYHAMEKIALNPLMLANSLVSPPTSSETPPYDTRAAIAKALAAWPAKELPHFWNRQVSELWSERKRAACNMCGYCGEFLCWGHSSPKSGTRVTTLRELPDLPNAQIRTDAQVYEVLYNSRTRRATGVRYLDLSDPDNPVNTTLHAQNVIVSCGAIQSARLLLMSGPPGGLGNRFDQVGRNVCFHLFGLGATALLPKKFQGHVHAEYGHTGNITGFDHYFLKDTRPGAPPGLKGKWCKGGTLASAAKKNPLENADGFVTRPQKLEDITGVGLLKNLEPYTRSVQLRVTGDDLPMPQNRVDLDPTFVDEYGLPAARVTRDFGPHERWMFDLVREKLNAIFDPYVKAGILKQTDVDAGFSGGIVDLIGDHQFGTCRMGGDPTASVVDPFCRVHDIPNLFVVDSSFMPTGLGVNPMITVVANALRVGTWIIEQAHSANGELS
jgi:choline dehydrogenase-like flavoprotein